MLAHSSTTTETRPPALQPAPIIKAHQRGYWPPRHQCGSVVPSSVRPSCSRRVLPAGPSGGPAEFPCVRLSYRHHQHRWAELESVKDRTGHVGSSTPSPRWGPREMIEVENSDSETRVTQFIDDTERRGLPSQEAKHL